MPYVPRRLTPGTNLGIPLLPDPRVSVAEANRIFLEREDWLWKHHQCYETKVFLGEPCHAGGGVELVAASTEDVIFNIAPITARPISFGCWAYRTNSHTGTPLSFGASAGTDYYSMRQTGSWNFQTYNGTQVRDVTSGAVVSDATWYHVQCTGASANDRDIWVNGADNANGTPNDGVTLTNWDQIKIGRHVWSGTNQPFNGRVAEAYAYASDDDGTIALQLAKGAHPLMVKPSALRFYAPMVRDFSAAQWHEFFSAVSTSESGTPDVVAHPPVTLPGALVQYGIPTAAAAGDQEPALIGGKLINRGLLQRHLVA